MAAVPLAQGGIQILGTSIRHGGGPNHRKADVRHLLCPQIMEKIMEAVQITVEQMFDVPRTTDHRENQGGDPTSRGADFDVLRATDRGTHCRGGSGHSPGGHLGPYRELIVVVTVSQMW